MFDAFDDEIAAAAGGRTAADESTLLPVTSPLFRKLTFAKLNALIVLLKGARRRTGVPGA